MPRSLSRTALIPNTGHNKVFQQTAPSAQQLKTALCASVQSEGANLQVQMLLIDFLICTTKLFLSYSKVFWFRAAGGLALSFFPYKGTPAQAAVPFSTFEAGLVFPVYEFRCFSLWFHAAISLVSFSAIYGGGFIQVREFWVPSSVKLFKTLSFFCSEFNLSCSAFLGYTWR